MSTTALSNTQSENTAHLSDKDLVEHIMSRVSWVPTESFARCMSTHCVDGRERCAVIGAPGGEAGEFLIGLAAVELITKREIPLESVQQIFDSFLEWNGHFYLHTDSHMLEKLLHDLQADELYREYFDGMEKESALEALEQFVRMPSTAVQDQLLEKLIRIVKLGCGHLALMREHSEEYGVRVPLVNAFLAAFYHALWRGERVEWEVLRGDHAERAVVNVYAADSGDVPSELPLVCPNCHGEQVFVNHPQAEQLVIERMHVFASRYFGGFHPIDKQVFVDNATALLQKHTAATLGYLAKGLPLYDARVHRNGTCDVSLKGTV